MSQAEFDEHASNYSSAHRQNIASTGEEPEYFANYKMKDFRALAEGIGLPQTGKYLDFGSGIGNSVRFFQKHMPSARLVCADVSQDSLKISHEHHGDAIEYAHLSDPRLPFEDETFDGAFACCVFHHIPHEDHAQVLSELRRVLKPGGLLMVYEHNPFNPLTVRAVRNCPFDANARLITANQLRQRCNGAGLKLHKVDFRVFFPASLAALRPLEDKLQWLPLGAQYFVAARA